MLGGLFVVVPAALYITSHSTVIELPDAPKVVQPGSKVALRLTNPNGDRTVVATIEQGGQRREVLRLEAPASRVFFWRTNAAPRTPTFEIPKLPSGKATIAVEAEANDLRAAVSRATIEVQVVSEPPSVSADPALLYLHQGGSGMIVFTPGGSTIESGVRTGGREYRSFALPGSTTGERFSLIAFAFDAPLNTQALAFGRNAAGTEATAAAKVRLKPRKFRKRELKLDETFLIKVANELDGGGAGSLLDRFLRVNREMRAKNNHALSDLRRKTEERWLWTQPFAQLANSQVESSFADVRSYVWEGKKVDEQIHFGFDLSVTQNVGVTAANDGKIVWAAPLGIYGNCVVIDHGYGLQTIYAHLSRMGVKDGESVKKGQPIGSSGDTGLAGGDHLHFSMQVDGVQVNPVEWWDAKWIKDHIRK